ncbi:hypothetical protein D3C80_1367380 [compost metagenome]
MDTAQRHLARQAAGGLGKVGFKQMGEGIDSAIGQYMVWRSFQQVRIEDRHLRHKVVMPQ